MPSVRLHLFLAGLVLASALKPAAAQDNLHEGKTPQQMFKTDCGICHRSVRGLGASMGAWRLTGFLAEHYTTSRAAASVIADYLMSVRRREPAARPQRRRTRPVRRRKQNPS